MRTRIAILLLIGMSVAVAEGAPNADNADAQRTQVAPVVEDHAEGAEVDRPCSPRCASATDRSATEATDPAFSCFWGGHGEWRYGYCGAGGDAC